MGPFGANSLITFGLSCSVRCSTSIFQKLHHFPGNLRFRKSIVINRLFKSYNIFVSSPTFLQIHHVAEWKRAYEFVKIILLPLIDRVEGSSPVHLTSFLRFDSPKGFLGFLWTLSTTLIDEIRNQIIYLFSIIYIYHY